MPLIMSFDQNFLNVFPMLSLKLELNMPLSLMREREREIHTSPCRRCCAYIYPLLCAVACVGVTFPLMLQ